MSSLFGKFILEQTKLWTEINIYFGDAQSLRQLEFEHLHRDFRARFIYHVFSSSNFIWTVKWARYLNWISNMECGTDMSDTTNMILTSILNFCYIWQ